MVLAKSTSDWWDAPGEAPDEALIGADEVGFHAALVAAYVPFATVDGSGRLLPMYGIPYIGFQFDELAMLLPGPEPCAPLPLGASPAKMLSSNGNGNISPFAPPFPMFPELLSPSAFARRMVSPFAVDRFVSHTSLSTVKTDTSSSSKIVDPELEEAAGAETVAPDMVVPVRAGALVEDDDEGNGWFSSSSSLVNDKSISRGALELDPASLELLGPDADAEPLPLVPSSLAVGKAAVEPVVSTCSVLTFFIAGAAEVSSVILRRQDASGIISTSSNSSSFSMSASSFLKYGSIRKSDSLINYHSKEAPYPNVSNLSPNTTVRGGDVKQRRYIDLHCDK